MSIEAFRLRKTEILFVAFAGWDAAGAKAFGYPTFWVNRLNSPLERLGFFPDAVGKELNDLIDFVRSAANRSRTEARIDRMSTRLNSSHNVISYYLFCLYYIS